jgi:hypothetical protein
MESQVELELKAAMQSLSNQDPEAAAQTLEALLGRDEPLEPMAEMFARGILATALAALGRITDARSSAERAHTIATELNDPASQDHYASLLRQLDIVGMSDSAIEEAFDRAALALDRGDSAAAESELQVVLIAALANLRVDLEASARGMFAQALLMRGAAAEARPHLERSLEIAKELADEGAAEHFTQVLASLDSGDGAERYRLEAAIARQADEVQEQAGKAMEAGDFDLAISLLQPVATEAEAANAKESEAALRGMLAQAFLLSGRRKDAEPEARRAMEIAEALGAKDAADSFRQILQLSIGWTVPVSNA